MMIFFAIMFFYIIEILQILCTLYFIDSISIWELKLEKKLLRYFKLQIFNEKYVTK